MIDSVCTGHNYRKGLRIKDFMLYLPMICKELLAAGNTSSKEYVELNDNIIDFAKLLSLSTKEGALVF